MKYARILKIFGFAVIISLVALAIPALPALAAASIELDPEEGSIGDTVEIFGEDFPETNNNYERYANIYFAADSVSVLDEIDYDVDTYSLVDDYVPIDTAGTFDGDFEVPDELNQGSDDEDVEEGETYYVYVTLTTINLETEVESISDTIRAKASFDVISGGVLDALSPSSGKPGTDVTVSGTDFASSKTISFKFDSTTLTRKSGDSKTDSDGDFATVITIPSNATVGTHIINVTIGNVTLPKTFTITATAALDPLSPDSGAPGTDVSIIGANFPANTALVFRFGNNTVTPSSGDTVTRSNGIFISYVTVPANTPAGAYTVTVTAGSSTASETFTVIASAALNPLSPASGEAGTDVTISGANFMLSYPIIFKFDGTVISPKSGSINTDTNGSFSSVITIPASAAAGDHTINVTVGSDTLDATFTVTGTGEPEPSGAVLSIETSGTHIGASIGIGGAGFTPGAEVTFKYDSKVVDTVQAGADGKVQSIFKAPASKAGAHTITVTDGTHTATTKFTVESKAPSTPPPLLPEMGAKVKSPVTFEWEPVTDDSLPVTYTLQIATDDTFDNDSIVLEKTGIEKSEDPTLESFEYMLSEADELKLENQEEAYYWRVRAVDAASNASPWTGGGEFYMAGSSSFPGWALYTIIGVGAVVVFLLGLWVGRRTAFYY
jgi:hypothetical protein